jgi:hypothetical protein
MADDMLFTSEPDESLMLPPSVVQRFQPLVSSDSPNSEQNWSEHHYHRTVDSLPKPACCDDLLLLEMPLEAPFNELHKTVDQPQSLYVDHAGNETAISCISMGSRHCNVEQRRKAKPIDLIELVLESVVSSISSSEAAVIKLWSRSSNCIRSIRFPGRNVVEARKFGKPIVPRSMALAVR